MRLFDLIEPAATVFGRKAPLIRLIADKCTRRLAVTEIDPVHHDEFIDDAADLARHFGAFHLHLKPERAIEFVEHPFEDADENDVLRSRVPELVEPEREFARVQSVSTAQIFCTCTLR